MLAESIFLACTNMITGYASTKVDNLNSLLEADRPQAVGRVVLAAFGKGDPILWTHFAPK
jgi:hypothetical protein